MKTIISLMFLVCLYGCSGGNRYENMESVKKHMPNAVIKTIPGKGFCFIAKENDGSIWYIETLNVCDTNISLKEQLF